MCSLQVSLLIRFILSRASWVACDIGFAEPLVLSALPTWTISLESPATVPVYVGLLIGAFSVKASKCWLNECVYVSAMRYFPPWCKKITLLIIFVAF